MSPCRACEAKCCRYFSLELDTPRAKNDFENIRWFLAHKDVSVFVEKRKWYLQVNNVCEYLTKEHKCKIYSKRPTICSEHDNSSCEGRFGDFDHEIVFKNLPELDKYLNKRFKRKKKNKIFKK